MAMKQTQTKMFDFTDVGLDFCSGSKNLFPDRFKKMLSQGYNEQTVASVSVTGNQVTLNYGVAHGYAADRVLKINSGPLAVINSGEFWIDAVTATSVTMTIDTAPISIAGGFVTKIASLGWGLVYEQAHIHIYKFKHIDDTDMYARFCFQNATTSGNRNCVTVGIGRTVDLNLGHITDPNCLQDLATCATVAGATSNIRWDFTTSTARTFDNYTYAQGYSVFGRGVLVGSIFHIAVLTSIGAGDRYGVAQGILPFKSKHFSVIDYPILLAQNNGASTTTASTGSLVYARIYAGSTSLAFHNNSTEVFQHSPSFQNFLPAEIDTFNTTMSMPLPVFTNSGRQFIGYCYGVYQLCTNSSYNVSTTQNASPFLTMDTDLSHHVIQHNMRTSAGNYYVAWLAFPIEEIKIG